MREHRLNARTGRSFARTANSKHNLPAGENPLNRDFSARGSGRKRVSGITYPRATDGRVYLVTVTDLFDRRVTGRAPGADREAVHTTVAAPKTAFRNRSAREGPPFHSGRGARYRARTFRETLGELCPTVRQSVSRKGECRDNAAAESFFKTLKREPETLDDKHPAAGVRQPVFMYIGAYYNRVRIQRTFSPTALDYLAPDMFYRGQAA
jgi:transposase InsO family protein